MSLRATRLAHAQFKTVEARSPESIIVAKALLAAALLAPDSAEAYAERVRTRFPNVLRSVDGDEAAGAPLLRADDLLRETWTRVTAEHTQELAKQRAASAGAPGGAGAAPPAPASGGGS